MRTTLTYEFNTPFNDINSYNPLETNSGYSIQRYLDSDGIYYAQPYKPNPYFIYLQAGSLQQNYPYSISWSDDIEYIFTSSTGTLASINVSLTKFQKSTGVFTTLGSIRWTPSEGAGTNKILYSVRASLDRWTTGTVGVSGTSVTGDGSLFTTSRISSGSRIGFGTDDPTQVSTWYEISSISSDTSLTLLTSAGSISPGTRYVIEELRVYTVHRRSAVPITAAGLHIVKGLHEGVFGSFTVINQATTVDRIRAFYKLDPGNSITNLYPLSCDLGEKVSDTEQYVYVQNTPGGSTTQFQFQVFNVRDNLVPTAGIDVSSWEFDTGLVTVVGTFIANGIKIGTLSSGPTSGIESIYVLTSSRVYACPFSNIFSGSTSYLTYSHFQTPPGTSNTYAATTYGQFDIDNSTNSLVIAASASPFAFTVEFFGGLSTRYFYPWTGRIRNASTSIDAAEAFTNSATTPNIWIKDGIMYTIVGTTTNNYIYSVPLSSDYSYFPSSGQYITTSILYTPGCVQFYSVNLYSKDFSGSDTLGGSADTCKIYIRTSGIMDNSGTWIEAPGNGNISTLIGAANQIQVAVTWDIMNASGITPWVYGVNVTYEDGSQDSHYLPSFANSSAAGRIFSFYQAQLWGGSIPNLRIRLYNVTTEFLIIDDDVNSSLYGAWQYSPDGGSTWLTWSSSADSVGNYIRYIANSLPASTRIRALLTI